MLLKAPNIHIEMNVKHTISTLTALGLNHQSYKRGHLKAFRIQ